MGGILRKCLWLVIVAVVVMETGCGPPTFVNPVPPPAQPAADESLLGTWVGGDKGDEPVIAIFPRKSGGLRIVFLETENDPEEADRPEDRAEDMMLFDGYGTSIGDNKVLCLRCRPDSDGHREFSDWIIAAYSVSKENVLTITLFSTEKVKEFIKANELEGEVTKGDFGDSVKVTATADDLVRVISHKGVSAFIDPADGVVFARSGK
jgi:hypothetical protein